MLFRTTTEIHPRSGKIFKISNTFKIKPFHAIERQVDICLSHLQSDIVGFKVIIKILLAVLAFSITMMIDLYATTWLIKSHQGQMVIVPTIIFKVASYIIVINVIYQLLKDLFKLTISGIRFLWINSYDFLHRHDWIGYQTEKEMAERFLTSEDISYQPNRKYHRGGK